MFYKLTVFIDVLYCRVYVIVAQGALVLFRQIFARLARLSERGMLAV